MEWLGKVISRSSLVPKLFVYFHAILDFQATPERLIMHLMEEHSIVDPTYIEDFLLTYRTFLESPLDVGIKLLEWFKIDSLRDKVSFINIKGMKVILTFEFYL